jgi:Domain of unknown function (DUF5668)
MNEQSTYLVQAARGPVIMITIGVLFAFDRFTEFHFSQTWPVLLIVIGLLRLVGGPRRRYRDYRASDAPSAPPPPPPPSGNYTSTQYSSSQYAAPSSDKGPEARP